MEPSPAKGNFEVEPEPATENKGPIRLKIAQIWRNVTVEPILFLYMLAMGFQSVPMDNLTVDKICRVELQLSAEICANVTETEHENDLQILAAQFASFSTYTYILPSVMFTLFLGAWSDKYGRRIPILLSLIGNVVFYVVIIVCIIVEESSLYYTLIANVLCGLSGGGVTFFVGAYSYLSDKTKDTEKTLRFSVADGISMLGVPIGTYLSGVLHTQVGMIGNLTICIGFVVLCAPLTMIFVLEGEKEDSASVKQMVKDFFDLGNLKSCFRTCFKKREKRNKSRLLLMTVALCFYVFPFSGEWTIFYLYTRRLFHWTPVDFSVLSSVSMIFGVVATLILIPILSSKLKIGEAVLGVSGTAFRLVSALIVCFASSPWMLYLASFIGIPSNGISVYIRSIMSFCVEEKELGQIFSVLTSCECLMPLITAVVYPAIYAAFSETFPGAPFVLSAITVIPVHFIFWYILIDMRREKEEHGTHIYSRFDSNSFRQARQSLPCIYKTHDDHELGVRKHVQRSDSIAK